MPETTDESEDLRPKVGSDTSPAKALSTVRLFTREPETQIPVHLEIASATPGAALKNLGIAIEWLKANKYVPHEGFVNKAAGGGFGGKRPAASGITCPLCKGDTWDNRAKKASGEYKEGSADITCKTDKDHKFNMEDGKLKKHWSMTKNEQPEYDGESSDDLPFE